MDRSDRRRAAAFVIPLLLSILAAARAAPRVRSIDFVALFGAGMIFGIGVAGLVRFIRARAQANRAGFRSR